MPVAKKISRIFRHSEKGTANPPFPARTLVGNPASPPIFQEYDDQDIAAVTQASLQDEITRLEQASLRTAQDNESLRSQLVSRDIENASLQTEADQARRRLNELLDTSSTETLSFDRRLRDLSHELCAAEEEKSQLRRDNTRLDTENTALHDDVRSLFALNQQYEAWMPQAKAIHIDQERKIRDLEQRLTLALQPMDEESRRAFNEAVESSREKEELQVSFEAEKTTLHQHIQNISNESRNKEEQFGKERRTWESRIATLEAALEDQEAKQLDAAGDIEALVAHQESLQEEFDSTRARLEEAQSQLSSLFSKIRELFGQEPTPRQLLFVKLFTRWFPRIQPNQAACSLFTQSHHAEDLTSTDLDTPLAETSLTTFVDSISPGSPGHRALQRLQFKRCPECKRHKLHGPPNDRNHNLIEYPGWFQQNKCPTCTLCTDCLKEKLKKTITEDWWYELDSPHWLKCPVAECQNPLDVGSVEAFVEMLRDFTVVDVLTFRGMYRSALTLREALSRVDPRPELEAISVSISLHKQLNAFGIFKDEFNIGGANYDNETEPFEAGEVLMGRVDRGNLQIPIFTKFFHRLETAEECPICLESYHEIKIESQDRWTQACEGYQGSWTSEVFSFPTRDAMQCDHDMNVCKICLQRHLESQLEQHGRNASGRLTCLTCNRVLSEQELRCLGSTETVKT